MTRHVRRLVSAVVVAGAAVAAVAGTTGVTAVPTVRVIDQSPATGATGTVELVNGNAIAVTIDHVASSGCSGITVTGAFPLAIPAGQMKPVTINCAPQTPGLHRCLFHADNAMNSDLVDFLGVCESSSQTFLTASSPSLAFPVVQVGSEASLPLAITNSGSGVIDTLDLQIDDLEGNFQIGMPCSPDQTSCDPTGFALGSGSGQAMLAIKCKPHHAGSLTAKLYVATPNVQAYRLPQPVMLTCTGAMSSQPAFSVSPSTVSVEPIEVVGGTAMASVHITNAGGGQLAITDVGVDDTGVPGASLDWTYAATGTCSGALPPECDLGPGASVDLVLMFDPSAIGARDASLRIGYHDTADRSTSIPLAGVGVGATLALLGSTSIDFGTVAVGQTSQVQFQLANRGSRDLHDVILGVGAGPITVAPPVISTITPTAPVTVTAQCKPTAPGPSSTTIHIASTDAAFGSPIDIAATCSGASSPLVAQPSTIALGEIRTGTTPPAIPIQIISTGAPLVLAGQPLLETPDPNLTLTPLSQMMTPASFTLVVTPTSDEIVANHILVTDTAGDSVAIPIGGSIVTASYDVPAMLSLGTFCVSSPTTPSAVALQSTGTATIGLPTAPAMISPTTPFDLTLTAPLIYPTSIAAGGIAAVEIAPKRTGVPSTQTDQLIWTTDVVGQTTRTSMITALFVSNGGAIAPSSLDFGQVPIHLVEDNGKRVTLQNCDTTTLSLDTPTIDDEFSIVSPNFPSQLMPNESTTFSVGFAPVNVGRIHGHLAITSTMLAQPLVVDLVGEGIAGGDDGDAGTGGPGLVDSSFYACGCRSTEPSGTIAIVVAVLAVVVPRRRRRRNVTTAIAMTTGQPRDGAPGPLHEHA